MSLRIRLSGAVDLLKVHRRDPKTFPFLLESVAGHPVSGRYDILFGFPGERIIGADGFDRLDAAAVGVLPEIADGLPFQGGWFLLLNYEAARYAEPRLRLPASSFALPDFLAVRCPAAIIVDRAKGETVLVAESDQGQIAYMKNVLQSIDDEHVSTSFQCAKPVEDDPERFTAGVARILDYLRDGDTFQVNLSRQWRAAVRGPAESSALYARLRAANPAPFSGLAVVGDVAVVSSSPERLVRVAGDRVETRPIAGTRPRGIGDDDVRLQQQLLGSLKERAEHIMLIDLERNDLGRVCVPGSVEVDELMRLESYTHVHHIVSNVRGRRRSGIGPGTVLRAVFPGGTITGCPKVRSMEIIAELEGVGRGPYTGAMGYLSRCGTLDTNILIRSLVLADGTVSLRAGAGIVADSEAHAELAETRAKARGLLQALRNAP